MSTTDAPTPVAPGAVIDQSVAAVATEICEHCGAPRLDTAVAWCRKCGYHPALDRVIELVGEDLETTGTAKVEEKKPNAFEGLSLLWQMMPKWVWCTGGAAFGAMFVALLGRVVTEPESLPRLCFALVLVSACAISAVAAHLWAFFYAVPESEKMGVAEIFVRPFLVWQPTFRDIENPAVWQRTALMAGGMTGLLFGIFVVGGIPWTRLWELGPHEPPKPKLVEAIENVGKEIDKKAVGPSAISKAVRRSADCVVLGYIPAVRLLGAGNAEQVDFEALVLASDIGGKLMYVGTATEGFTEAERAEIVRRIPKLRRDQPYVPCSVDATWLRPALTCRVTYERLSELNRFEKMQWGKLLAEVSAGKEEGK